jgi:hypothetical protein
MQWPLTSQSHGVTHQGCQIFKPKFPIWVNFGGSCNGRCWYITWPFCLLNSYLIYFVATRYIFWLLGIFFPFWYFAPRKIRQPWHLDIFAASNKKKLFQKSFSLSGTEVRALAVAEPNLFTWRGVPFQVPKPFRVLRDIDVKASSKLWQIFKRGQFFTSPLVPRGEICPLG